MDLFYGTDQDLSSIKRHLKTYSDGVVRVGNTRITLDTVITAFKEGAAAEEIVYHYPTLHLADVYAVLSYYLRRPEEIEDYLNQRRHKANEVKRQYSSLFDNQGIRVNGVTIQF